VWSNDGQRLAYNSVSNEEFAIWERRADGAGEAEKLLAGPTTHLLFPVAWSPDGKTLAVLKVDLTKSTTDVLMLEKDATSGTWTATPYLNGNANEGPLAFSADGKWVRYVSTETGREELYVQRFTGAKSGPQDAQSGRVQISTAGAQSAGWSSPDGKEIRFVDSNGRLMSVQVQTEPTLSVSLPKTLMNVKDLKAMMLCEFSPDGRLLAIMKSEDESKNRIDLVVNFVDEMRAKVDAPK
jgi:Tol biopolymer transport system component